MVDVVGSTALEQGGSNTLLLSDFRSPPSYMQVESNVWGVILATTNLAADRVEAALDFERRIWRVYILLRGQVYTIHLDEHLQDCQELFELVAEIKLTY